MVREVACAVTELSVYYQQRFFLSFVSSLFLPGYVSPRRSYHSAAIITLTSSSDIKPDICIHLENSRETPNTDIYSDHYIMSACLRLSVFISQAMRSMFNISLYEWTVPTFNQFPKYSSNDGHIEIVKSLHSGQPAWLDVGFLVSSGESCPWARKNLISCVQNALVIGSPRCFEANQSSQIPLNVILRSWSMG